MKTAFKNGDAFVWLTGGALAFALLMVTSLRLSANSPRRTHFYALGLAAAANAVASAWFFVHTQLPGISR